MRVSVRTPLCVYMCLLERERACTCVDNKKCLCVFQSIGYVNPCPTNQICTMQCTHTHARSHARTLTHTHTHTHTHARARARAHVRPHAHTKNLYYTLHTQAYTYTSLNNWPSVLSGNAAFLALAASEAGIAANKFRPWAIEQINYMLGDNNHDGGCFSFAIGVGDKYPVNPHHRSA